MAKKPFSFRKDMKTDKDGIALLPFLDHRVLLLSQRHTYDIMIKLLTAVPYEITVTARYIETFEGGTYEHSVSLGDHNMSPGGVLKIPNVTVKGAPIAILLGHKGLGVVRCNVSARRAEDIAKRAEDIAKRAEETKYVRSNTAGDSDVRETIERHPELGDKYSDGEVFATYDGGIITDSVPTQGAVDASDQG